MKPAVIHPVRSAANIDSPPAHRNGSVLLSVLVVVMLLSLAAYTFSEISLAEAEATAQSGRAAQARAFADSGAELVAALLGDQSETAMVNFYHNPQMFGAVLMRDSEYPADRGRFSVIAPVENDATGRSIRYGLIDESGKLNLNAIAAWELDEEQSRFLLMNLPGMTEDIADAILDWIDEDNERRQFGAESDDYQALSTPYVAQNGPLNSLDELLMVRGVTPWLLYGEDANRNGLLDPNENDGDQSAPADDADGLLHPGWSAFLTVYSRETNLRPDGTEKIDINQPTLVALYDELAEEFDEDVATFIVAYRAFGPMDDGTLRSGDLDKLDDPASQATQSEKEQLNRFAQQMSRAMFSGRGASQSRGGLKGPLVAQHDIGSLYDLVDTTVNATMEDDSQQELISPWSSDGSQLKEDLPLLIAALRLNSAEFIEGRVNINQARREVLLGLPAMTEELAGNIVNATAITSGGQPVDDLVAGRTTTGWLLWEGIAELEDLRLLDRFITARGDVYRAQVLGHFDGGGPAVRIETVIDASQVPPRVIATRELTDLGRGYPASLLTPATTMQTSGLPAP